MSSWIALLALVATSEPAPMVLVSPVVSDTSVVTIPERVLAQRSRLRLSEGQVARLRGLADKYRFQENRDRLSSKSWLRRAPTWSEARTETLRELSADQRRVGVDVIR